MTLRERLESPEVVEAVAKAAFEANHKNFGWKHGDWQLTEEPVKEHWRFVAQAAITAMLAALNPKEMSNDDR